MKYASLGLPANLHSTRTTASKRTRKTAIVHFQKRVIVNCSTRSRAPAPKISYEPKSLSQYLRGGYRKSVTKRSSLALGDEKYFCITKFRIILQTRDLECGSLAAAFPNDSHDPIFGEA